MRGFGIFLVIAGIIWALIAFNMDTTVTTDSQRYGSGEYAIDVPSVTVNNLGLMETRRNNLMFAGLTILAGVVLIGFGSIKRPAAEESCLKPCPFCAEQIQPAALKCRFCNSGLPDNFRAVISTPPVIQVTESEMLRSHFALIEQGSASIDTYMDVARILGGSLTSNGFLMGQHYVVDLDGVKNRIDNFENLRRWFLDNAASHMSA